MERVFLASALFTVLFWTSSCSTSGTQEPGTTDSTTTVTALPDSIHLKATNGLFVCADLGAAGDEFGVLIANRVEASLWETFALKDLGAGKVALVAANGKYVCADRSVGGRLKADRDVAGDWETFELMDLPDGAKGLRTTEGLFVCAELGIEGNGQGTLYANRQEAGEWETFRVEPAVAR
ncbi:MAG: hypothetical protein MUE88_02460 [Flavobacteriales bacterium]|jgi:hypothetical protein|nr:hypothetical protein [Flavobacteriales bacterium]